jgi:hypothetical protein
VRVLPPDDPLFTGGIETFSIRKPAPEEKKPQPKKPKKRKEVK